MKTEQRESSSSLAIGSLVDLDQLERSAGCSCQAHDDNPWPDPPPPKPKPQED